MSKPIIEINNLHKRYKYGQRQPYHTLRDTLANAFKRSKNEIDYFWALKDVSLEIAEGEVVGIIGPNGSGKTTLLKILSRITPPTKGSITLRGRVGSLLEVGTGFHLELTGRENIYLNGAILGMKKSEIAKKFDEIVMFSGVEKFLDTPVKRYSSGMLVRLGFAVAAHLEPEILIIDEVLAVGDAEFQNKCLKKMGEVAKGGRTILFVSHNMNSIEQLCSRAVYLKSGKIVTSGKVGKVISHYLQSVGGNERTEWRNGLSKFYNLYYIPETIRLLDQNGKKLNTSFNNANGAWLEFKGKVIKPTGMLVFGYNLYQAKSNTLLYTSLSTDGKFEAWLKHKKGDYSVYTQIPGRFLNEDDYKVEPFIMLRKTLADKTFIIKPGESEVSLILKIRGGLSDSPLWTENRGGLIAPVMTWKNSL